jgi:hypothetical protein
MTTLSTEEFATYVARTGALGVTLRELQQKVTYKGWVEHIGLIPRGLVWREHFPYTKKKMAGLLLATAEIERALGRDGADLISRIVDAKTGKPTGRAYLAMLKRQAEKAHPPLADDEDEDIFE